MNLMKSRVVSVWKSIDHMCCENLILSSEVRAVQVEVDRSSGAKMKLLIAGPVSCEMEIQSLLHQAPCRANCARSTSLNPLHRPTKLPLQTNAGVGESKKIIDSSHSVLCSHFSFNFSLPFPSSPHNTTYWHSQWIQLALFHSSPVSTSRRRLSSARIV